ncbi:hypothetical protein SFRURICE_005014 [Spodoptera frugiperda]|nr:hypothetical protein SFRURICE_005014 [Spodoptera frugiperda]
MCTFLLRPTGFQDRQCIPFRLPRSWMCVLKTELFIVECSGSEYRRGRSYTAQAHRQTQEHDQEAAGGAGGGGGAGDCHYDDCSRSGLREFSGAVVTAGRECSDAARPAPECAGNPKATRAVHGDATRTFGCAAVCCQTPLAGEYQPPAATAAGSGCALRLYWWVAGGCVVAAGATAGGGG